jgi:hypothetical protein
MSGQGPESEPPDRADFRARRRILLYAPTSAMLLVLLVLPAARPPVDLEGALAEVLERSGAGDLAGAHRRLDSLEEQTGPHLKILLARGFLHELGGDLDAAEGVYQVALGHCTDSGARLVLEVAVAELHRRRGDLEGAGGLLDRATAAHGESARSRRFRVLLKHDQGDLAGALREARVLAEENPGDVAARRLVRQLEALPGTVPGDGLEVRVAGR